MASGYCIGRQCRSFSVQLCRGQQFLAIGPYQSLPVFFFLSVFLRHNWHTALYVLGFPAGSDNKESACNAWDLGSIPRLGRFPRKGDGYWLQHSCLENSMDRGAWQATVHGVAESDGTLYPFKVFSKMTYLHYEMMTIIHWVNVIS